MRTANELYEFTMAQAPILVDRVLDGVKEHIVEKCEERARQGATNYSIYLKKEYAYIKDLLLERCIELIKEFEDNGYKISIDDVGNENYVKFIITVSWNGLLECYPNRPFKEARHLYNSMCNKII